MDPHLETSHRVTTNIKPTTLVVVHTELSALLILDMTEWTVLGLQLKKAIHAYCYETLVDGALSHFGCKFDH